MPRQLTLNEPRQLSLLSSSGRPVTRADVDENDERPSANARSGQISNLGTPRGIANFKISPLDDLVDVVGDCHACGMPAFDLGTGGRRACRCGKGLCDPFGGTDCGSADGRCWDCYHADEDLGDGC